MKEALKPLHRSRAMTSEHSTGVENPLTRTVRTATDVGAPDAGISMMDLDDGAAQPQRDHEHFIQRDHEHFMRLVENDLDAATTGKLLIMLAEQKNINLEGMFDKIDSMQASAQSNGGSRCSRLFP